MALNIILIHVPLFLLAFQGATKEFYVSLIFSYLIPSSKYSCVLSTSLSIQEVFFLQNPVKRSTIPVTVQLTMTKVELKKMLKLIC